MPTYAFSCENCGQRFEVFATFRQKEQGLRPQCPECGSERVKQAIGSLVFIARSGPATPFSGNGGGCCSIPRG